ncbi:ribonuclease H family protein [Fuscibacter oryzae]|uniref:Ribonuclease H n=1 Tax=Fuscibacter oryzae TaxID=2803939 RepID=A0A8J7MT56_9RHOB|nr:ribonuclease H [Fuscibacter oryzae]MBL4927938.1 ribonuclease HI [Fuscibacter oryzae]
MNDMNPLRPALADTTMTTERDDQPTMGQTRIEIYTDGSSIGNPGPGGYGIVTLRLDADGTILKHRKRKGSEPTPTTNIRMEMTASCVALESLGFPTAEPITVYCDLDLIPKAMNEWLAKWRANGWKKGSGKAPENRDLWDRLERAAEGRKVTFAWVRGHNGAEHNELADKLAYAGAREAEGVFLPDGAANKA